MAHLTSPFRTDKPLSDSSVFSWSWMLRPSGGVGFLLIGNDLYQTTEQQYEHDNGAGAFAVLLRKSDAAECLVTPAPDGNVFCTCNHYRGECEHTRAVAAAYRQLDVEAELARMPWPPAA